MMPHVASALISLSNIRFFLLLTFALSILTSCANLPDTSTPVSPIATRPGLSTQVVNPIGDTNVEAAHARLEAEGAHAVLVLISSNDPDVEDLIYWDLTGRQIRATTGPDEGIDTRTESCYPDCVFVRREDADTLGIDTWVVVLRHEYRHIDQARNNPNMARDFRGPDGRFTPFAAFQEACADYGINVKVSYHAQERIDKLKQVLGVELEGTLDQACQGQPWAYRIIFEQYNKKSADAGAFNALFPSYN